MENLKVLKCNSCGSEIHFKPEFEGLPCNQYCCACCPSKNQRKCPNEQKFNVWGSFLKSNKVF